MDQVLDSRPQQISSAAAAKLGIEVSSLARFDGQELALGSSNQLEPCLPLLNITNAKLLGNYQDTEGASLAFNGVNVQGLGKAKSYLVGQFSDPSGALGYVLITSDQLISNYSEAAQDYQFYVLEGNAASPKLYKAVFEKGQQPRDWELYEGIDFSHSLSKGKLLYNLTPS